MPEPVSERDARRTRLVSGFRGRGLDQVVLDPELRADLRAEADSRGQDKLITHDLLRVADWSRQIVRGNAPLALFFSTDDVILIPGFLGSELVDVQGSGG